MIFMSYWLAAFAVVFFPLYWVTWNNLARRLILLTFCVVFHTHFAGPAGVLPIIALGIITYLAGLSRNQAAILTAIGLNAVALIFYKYTLFLSEGLIGIFHPEMARMAATFAKAELLPVAPPLAISFFVFEFVHYLIDVKRGEATIRSPLQFSLFSVFWPSIVAGPIKRYEQFLPELYRATSQRTETGDIIAGITRVAVGFVKKSIADNLTLMINLYGSQFETMNLASRWLLVVGIAFRILLDFSGYSDMAIGFARMMGIKLPENFNWPYIATSPAEFWRRWHISLSTWIRDYVYIPLGGGRRGPTRRILNALVAFALCGLWHGAGWNFAVWGVYHGVGVAASGMAGSVMDRWRLPAIFTAVKTPVGWAITFLFVLIGWLFFFYPLARALTMTRLLFTVS
jgi:alginate O-acetyltransferase complex protein AlgI